VCQHITCGPPGGPHQYTGCHQHWKRACLQGLTQMHSKSSGECNADRVCVNVDHVQRSPLHISTQAATVGTISSPLLPEALPLCVLRRIVRERPSRSCRCTVTHPSGGDNLYAGLHCRARRAKPLGRIAYGSPKVFRHAFACLPHFGCSSGTLFICGLFSWRYRGISKRLFDFPHLTCYDGYMEHHIAPSFLATDS